MGGGGGSGGGGIGGGMGGSMGGSGGGGSLMGSGPMQRGPSTGSNAGGSVGGVGGGAGGPRALASSDTIIVRNLPENCTWQGLREGFSHCGEIKYAEMKERDAERAMSVMDKHQIGNRAIEVRLY